MLLQGNTCPRVWWVGSFCFCKWMRTEQTDPTETGKRLELGLNQEQSRDGLKQINSFTGQWQKKSKSAAERTTQLLTKGRPRLGPLQQ